LERVLLQRLTGDPKRDRPIHLRMIEVDRDILRIDPVNPFVRKNLAEALYNIGDRQGAADELNTALQFEPNYVPAYIRLSEWFQESGDGTRGAAYRQRGIAVAMKYRNEKTSEVYESLLLGRPQ
jgi:predicted Zn-dependent protease